MSKLGLTYREVLSEHLRIDGLPSNVSSLLRTLNGFFFIWFNKVNSNYSVFQIQSTFLL